MSATTLPANTSSLTEAGTSLADEFKNENLDYDDEVEGDIERKCEANEKHTDEADFQITEQQSSSNNVNNKKRKHDDEVMNSNQEGRNGSLKANSESHNFDDDLGDQQEEPHQQHKRSNSNASQDSSIIYDHSVSNNNVQANKNTNKDQKDVTMKLMIPSSCAGAVIGRGGEKIAQIQRDAQVKIKMSKANEHYPNTSERVCLVVGSIPSVLKAHDLIVERMLLKEMKSDNKNDSISTSNGVSDERFNQIKILIPNSTAGLLIGKAGAFIKQINDESGAHVHISARSQQSNLTAERIVSIQDEDQKKRTKALELVVKKMSEDPQHASQSNLSYSNSQSNGADSAGTASNQQNGGQKFDFNSAANYLAGLNNLAMLIINCGGSFQMTSDSLKATLRNHFNQTSTNEIIDAISCLVHHGLITKIPPTAVAASLGSVNNSLFMANLANSLSQQHQQQPSQMNNSMLSNFNGNLAHHQQSASSHQFSNNYPNQHPYQQNNQQVNNGVNGNYFNGNSGNHRHTNHHNHHHNSYNQQQNMHNGGYNGKMTNSKK